jgi:hypothetical protein
MHPNEKMSFLKRESFNSEAMVATQIPLINGSSRRCEIGFLLEEV